MRPDVARDALLATHGGLSLELCAVICHVSPMALYRLACALGHQGLVTVLTRCGLPHIPSDFVVNQWPLDSESSADPRFPESTRCLDDVFS